MDTIRDLLERLNATDECNTIEAKKGSSIGRSVMETVCALSNEPGLNGGYILLGIERNENTLFPSYEVTGVEQADKIQSDFSTQCASTFNLPVRPDVEVEQMQNGRNAIKVFIHELPDGQKPLYFKHESLPKGAFRRIGATDQHCTDDDLHIFYNTEDSIDSTIVKNSSLIDVSDEALKSYRTLRRKVNPYAEELNYNNEELMQALGCTSNLNLTYTGLLVFGKTSALRRFFPMVRVDYIRVTGNEWLPDPEKRFTTVDMRGSLIELVQRTFTTIADDLPKGFLLPEGQIQAEVTGLPSRVLREALVNAFIHRTYREHQPIQIIRYSNRIEISNPGFSLKSEEQLGDPGSKSRNPFIAAIFHETNLAETKGSGIRTMRLFMEEAGMAPPTFESDHSENRFTVRLLLHHFLSEEDLVWLSLFDEFQLTDSQKRSLIFVREAGAIDNSTHRQLNHIDILKASGELRALRDYDIFRQKGKGRATYYLKGPEFDSLTELFNIYQKKAQAKFLNQNVKSFTNLIKPVVSATEPVTGSVRNLSELVKGIPNELLIRLKGMGKRSNDRKEINSLIIDICELKPYKLTELAVILNRAEKHLLYNYVTPLRESNKISYLYPDMPNHPEQAYCVKASSDQNEHL